MTSRKFHSKSNQRRTWRDFHGVARAPQRHVLRIVGRDDAELGRVLGGHSRCPDGVEDVEPAGG